MSKKRVFSGIKPSGDTHLGNYIGAISQWVKNQDQYDNFFCVVDLHAITVPIDKEELHKQIRSIAAWYIASGINPDISTIFIQSHNPDHTQLGWILNCYTGMGQLSRMTQYKDKKEKTEFVSAGLFDYPVLMAADILLYDADLVPVGEDQKQHVELTRDLAERLNQKNENLFTLPTYMPPPAGERIMSLQHPENKMSKSEADVQGTIYLQDEPDVIRKKIMSSVTDNNTKIEINPTRPAISNLATIFVALSGKTIQELDAEYSGKGYKVFKEDLAELTIKTLTPIKENYQEILNSDRLDTILADGAKKARSISEKKLSQVYEALGFVLV